MSEMIYTYQKEHRFLVEICMSILNALEIVSYKRMEFLSMKRHSF